jgi:hypothetical protein
MTSDIFLIMLKSKKKDDLMHPSFKFDFWGLIQASFLTNQ